ncbi:ryR domain-containing protein [Phthorimaea operculella]|nr:ryR domain-containing protein [Phthorimaea operculella]
MDYEPELFGKALPYLIAIGCALPPDYSLSKNYDDEFYGKEPQATGRETPGEPANPQYDPQPINTTSVALNNDLNTIVQKFSEHYHDAWASSSLLTVFLYLRRKIENGWVYGESYSESQKAHPRLKPYNMLNDYNPDQLGPDLSLIDMQQKLLTLESRCGAVASTTASDAEGSGFNSRWGHSQS